MFLSLLDEWEKTQSRLFKSSNKHKQVATWCFLFGKFSPNGDFFLNGKKIGDLCFLNCPNFEKKGDYSKSSDSILSSSG